MAAHRRFLAHKAWNERRLWRLSLEGRAAVVRGWGGAMEIRFPAKALRDPHALSKRGL